MKKIYAIYDKLAQAVVGSLMMFPADPAAVRWFTDGLTSEGSLLAKHPQDFQLVQLGHLEGDGEGIPTLDACLPRVILDGAAWRAAAEASASRADDSQLSLLRKEA